MALDDGRVVSNFVSQALLGQDLTVYGNGQQTRSFQYIDDLVLGLVKMMDSALPLPTPVDLVERGLRCILCFFHFCGVHSSSLQQIVSLARPPPVAPVLADNKYTGPFNIGNPSEFTMLELAEVVKEVVNPNTNIIFMENTSDDPGRRQVSCHSLKSHQNYDCAPPVAPLPSSG